MSMRRVCKHNPCPVPVWGRKKFCTKKCENAHWNPRRKLRTPAAFLVTERCLADHDRVAALAKQYAAIGYDPDEPDMTDEDLLEWERSQA